MVRWPMERIRERGWAEKESSSVNPKHFADHERGATVQFDWLVARQSKSGIRKLTFSIIRHPEHDKIKIHMPRKHTREAGMKERISKASTCILMVSPL